MLLLYFIFAALIVLIDRIVKMWASSALEPGQAIQLIPGFIRLTYVENTGAAFSLLADKRWLLVIISSVAVLGLIAVILLYRDGELGRLGASFVLGGAVGNLVDRIATGSVVDMFEFEFVNFAIFNVADIFITVGGLIFIIHIIIFAAQKRPQKAPSPAAVIAYAERPDTELPETPEPDETMVFTEEQILEEYYIEQQMEADDDA